MSEIKSCSTAEIQTMHCSTPCDTLFILNPRPMIAKLPHRFESGELITTDGRWVQIRTASAQTFHRTRKRFRISGYSCYVGESLPFIEEYRKKIALFSCACGLLIVSLLTTNFFPISGLANLPTHPAENAPLTFTDSRKEIQATEMVEVNVLKTEKIATPEPNLMKTRQRGNQNQPRDLDPLRCTPIPNKSIPKSVSKSGPKTEGNAGGNAGGWYVCR